MGVAFFGGRFRAEGVALGGEEVLQARAELAAFDAGGEKVLFDQDGLADFVLEGLQGVTILWPVDETEPLVGVVAEEVRIVPAENAAAESVLGLSFSETSS